MKVALVYDRVNKWGGAERVLLALHEIFPDAPLYTSVYSPEKASWAKVFDVHTSFLQNFPFSKRHEFYASLMPLAFESFNFDGYDLVISLTSEAAKGIITKPGTLHICYCLTPTRYLWSGYDLYFRNRLLRFLSKPVISYLKFWDKVAAQRPDYFIAISKEVQKRIKNYYGRGSAVIYPPLTLSYARGPLYSAGPAAYQPHAFPTRLTRRGPPHGAPRLASPAGYYLVVSRLVPYKRVEIAVKAFNKLGLPLKIVGSGSEEQKLKSMARKNIEFLGSLTDEKLVGYYKDCLALIFPGIEDFGLTILEAQSFGKPVIAYRGGGAQESIIEGKTGVFFDRQSPESLTQALKQFNNLTINPEDCIKNAQKFSLERFKDQIMKLVQG